MADYRGKQSEDCIESSWMSARLWQNESTNHRVPEFAYEWFALVEKQKLQHEQNAPFEKKADIVTQPDMPTIRKQAHALREAHCPITPLPLSQSVPPSKHAHPSPEADEALQQSKRELDLLQQARIAILAAKTAYATKSNRWLPLLSKAMGTIEICPEELRPHLMKELCSFHIAWRNRPRLRRR